MRNYKTEYLFKDCAFARKPIKFSELRVKRRHMQICVHTETRMTEIRCNSFSALYKKVLPTNQHYFLVYLRKEHATVLVDNQGYDYARYVARFSSYEWRVVEIN